MLKKKGLSFDGVEEDLVPRSKGKKRRLILMKDNQVINRIHVIDV